MSDLRDKFWETLPLEDLTRPEWEALCDGCGKCCMNKLEDDETGEVAFTRVACRLFDDSTCKCSQYPIRHQFVPECIVMTPENIESHMYWLPQTCAYRLRQLGQPLFNWHPLISGDPNSALSAGVSMHNATTPEFEVDEDDWEEHIVSEPMGH